MNPGHSPNNPNQGVHQQAQAADHARIHQAGRDQHFHYADGARREQRTAPGQSAPECPYPGLAAFGPDQARWFFGRDLLIAELTNRLDQRLHTGGLQMVVAPSGAGKSSLLRAGLLPKLAQATLPNSDRWPKAVLTPTANPLWALATTLARIIGANPAAVAHELTTDPTRCLARLTHTLYGRTGDQDPRCVIVVDQFEQLFTQCSDDRQRRAFIDLLTWLAGAHPDTRADPVTLVVLGVRSDFYTACVAHPPLRAALQDAPLVVGPMSEPDLREVILYPAQNVGLDVEPGLVDVLLGDLGVVAGAYKAGRLPLLAHALRMSWQQRHGWTMTVAGYRATGGIHWAVATTAEWLFATLNPAAQQAAPGVFLRLVDLGGEGHHIDDTRRQVPRTDLLRTATDPTAVAAIIDTFTQGRLLTQENDTVEITHEALLHAWPRLRDWLNTDRAGSRVAQELEDTALVWDRNRADTAILLRGSRLETARMWATTRPAAALSVVGAAFLATSLWHQRRATRFRRAAILSLVILTVAATTLAGVALQQRGTAQTETQIATQQRDLATLSQITTQADLLRNTNPTLAAQLDVTAYRRNPSPGPQPDLIVDANTPMNIPLTGHTGYVSSVAFSPNGHVLASGSADKTIRLWDMTNPSHPTPLGRPLTGHTDFVSSVAFSPDGHLLATGSFDRTVRLWNVTNPSHPTLLGQPLIGATRSVYSVAFSPNSHILASGSADHTIRLWNVTDSNHPTLLGQPLTGDTDAVNSVAFSPNGDVLASGGWDKTVRLWNVTDPSHPTPLGQPLTGGTNRVSSVAFSPNGNVLASGSLDDTIRLWNVTDPSRPTLLRQPIGDLQAISSLAFSPDGRILASSSWDESIWLWNVTNPSNPTVLAAPLIGATNLPYSVEFSPNGHTLATGNGDNTVRMWDIPSTILIGHTDKINSVAFSPSGHILASGSSDDTIRLWNTTDPNHPTPLGLPLTGDTDLIYSVAFSPDGHILASGSADRTIRLWNVTDPNHPTPLGQPLTGDTDAVPSVVFSPDGHTLATGSLDDTIRLWNMTNPSQPTLLRPPVAANSNGVSALAFSPDGHTLASGGLDNTIRLWNVADPSQPSPLGQPLTGHSNGILSLVFSPDGHTLATGSADHTIRLWNVTDPSHATSSGQPLVGHTDAVESVTFSPDGRVLASGGIDNSIRLWEVADPGHPVPLGQPFVGHGSYVFSVVFSRDGNTLASSSADGTVRLWDMNPEQDIQRICDAPTHDMTPQQWHALVPELPYTPPCQ